MELAQGGSVINWATPSTSCIGILGWDILGECKPWHGGQCHCLSRFYKNLLSILDDALIALRHLFDTYFDAELYYTILHFLLLWWLPFDDRMQFTILRV